jgi:hypothetical protein
VTADLESLATRMVEPAEVTLPGRKQELRDTASRDWPRVNCREIETGERAVGLTPLQREIVGWEP